MTSQPVAPPKPDGADTAGRLAATKLHPPRRPAGIIARPRLTRLFHSGVRGALTLVVGPPGSGKTVAVGSWAEKAGPRLGWLALDATDASPVRFWVGVARALREAGVQGVSVPAPGQADVGNAFCAELIDALAGIDEPVVLVLDDFHEVANRVGAELDRLLDHPPEALRLIVLTRRDPPFRLSRLRLAGALTEVRYADLACTREETDAVLRCAGVRLPDPSVTRVRERTEGWMAAVRLAPMTLRDSDAPTELVEELGGEDTVISDYLMSEVLSRQSAEVQDFLLRTSIVDILDGRLAEVLTGQPAGHARLTELASDGVLVSPVDRRARWFRYHGLFGELLQARLRWSLPDAGTELHARAAAWFAEQGDETRAVRHAIAAGDWDLAATIASGRWVELLLRGELDTLTPLLSTIPHDRVQADPALAVALAAVSLEIEEPQRAAGRVQRARSAVARAHEVDAATAAALALVELLHARHTGEREQALAAANAVLDPHDVDSPEIDAALRSLVWTYLGTAESWTGRVVEAREHLQRALTAARQAESPWLTLHALAYLAGATANRGDVPGAQRRAEQALRLAREHGWTRTSAAGAAAWIAALIATLQCRFDDATELVDVADRVVWQPHDRPMRAAVALPRLVLLTVQGRVDDALDVVREALAELSDWPVDRAILVALKAWEARLLAATGDRAGALHVLDEASSPSALLVLATKARFLVDDGDFEAARALLAPGLAYDGPAFTSVIVDLWLVDALALDGLVETEAAAESLERALALAAPGELVRPIVSHGNAILPLLHRQTRFGTQHRALLDRAVRLIEGHAPATRAASSGLAEPLSARERRILGYLPTIMSNRDIADELYISVNTVKTHMRSIYRKLGVDDRRAAVARAKELRILGSSG